MCALRVCVYGEGKSSKAAYNESGLKGVSKKGIERNVDRVCQYKKRRKVCR